MELGERLKQARLEAGLSQRQLCADVITRNMLSQIENGSARPSMDTLRALAARLGKPIGYFLEEQAVTSPNQTVMAQARQAEAAEALELLKTYQSPDPVFDAERWLLETLACLELAEQAIAAGKPVYAVQLLEQAAEAGAATPYYTQESERRRLLLCFEANAASAQALTARLPDNSRELQLRAAAALEQNAPQQCAAILDTAPTRDARWHYLRAEACLAQKQYTQAAEHYHRAEETLSQKVYPKLEQCYRELKNFEMAYFYACKQR